MSKKPEFLVGVDVGTSRVVAAVGELHDGGVSLIGLGTAACEGLRKGVVVNIDATVQSIEAALKEAELAASVEIHSVYVDVGGSHIRGINSHGVVGVREQEVGVEDIERVLDAARAIALPADYDVLHVMAQDFEVDGQGGIRSPLGMTGVRLEARVHVIAAAAAHVRNVTKCCQRAGLHVADVVLEPLAAAEAVLTPEEKELGVAVVDLGAGTTDVIVFHNGAVRHTAVLALGGNHVTSDVAAGLRTPFRDAEILKIRSGTVGARAAGRELSVEIPTVGAREARLVSRLELGHIIEARVEEILRFVEAQLDKSGLQGALTSGIVLTGGGALLDGIGPLAERILRNPVRIGRPILAEGSANEASSPDFAAAVGLVQYGASPRDEFIPVRGEPEGSWGRWRGRMRDWWKKFF